LPGFTPIPALLPDSPRQGATTYGRILSLAGGNEVTSAMRGQDRGSIAAALYTSPAYSLQLPPLGVSRLSINLTTSRVTGGVDGERGRSFEAKRHSLFLTPAGAPTRWRKSSPSRHLNIYFRSPAILDDGQDELGRQLQQCGPIFNLVLPGSGALIKQLAREMSEGGPFSGEAVESLALLMLVQLARRHLNSDGPGLMSAQRMARLGEYIAANLGECILVADLAAVAGLPAGRFAHAFTRYTGRSPHQYVLSRRVEHATAMLRRGQCSLAEVAAACGFASQQHMTVVLRVRLGVTPAALRGAPSVPRESR
jgi:AraC family transcriptional regulator